MAQVFRLFLLISFLLAGPVAAQDLVTAAEPEKILQIARGFGSAELTTSDSGNPLIKGRMEGRQYRLYFYGCTDGIRCATITFWTYMAAPADGMEATNRWNRDYRFGKTYIDQDGDVVLEMDVNLWGGVSVANLDDTFDWWRTVLQRADTVFGSAPAQPAPDRPEQRDSTL